ncbi:peptide/nickel transport system substrate-binding protein [Tissierella praeacuta DSM 18095]|uniref:Peptide/nickel transport system substrate-binding protein n=1 Tax=Tissierella praeacuta DSM 18095 TaxID=1123404 RepID=A0A1M4WAJ3_9FIRM|nr:ABC transporter substrate-binding protein [Tissierella praeacuta]TCU75533.1 peptide/nickel transport system substrate-binding protein [Tissierella praeacuta]SHE77982.1 peptide/nickel transport system substrate-binding protein [Tissierella praeacuta DSM 18095]SUO99936.1 Nickel-binding periplasmic protein precursor [Tissierella praeacuta]
MKKYKKGILIFLCLVVIGSLVACQSKKVPNKDIGETKETESNLKKDELIVSMGERIPHEFDPKQRWGMYNEAHIIHSTLLMKTADLDIVGDLAKDYSISEDGKIWSFNLHDNFKFSNGELVTAEDVKFSYDMLKEYGQHWDLGFIDKIEIPEENKVKIYLNEPRSTFWAQLTEVPIVPKNHYNDNYSQNPIGSGPYMVTQYDKDEQAIFEVNPYWHGEEPYFKKWTWVCLDENTALAAAKAGKVDIIYAIPEFADEELPGWKLFEFESNDVRGLSLPYVKPGKIESPDGYPVGNEVTSDPIIRKALNIGLNRQEIVDTVLNGHGKPAYSVIDGMPWWNPETAIEDGRVEEAKKLLDEAGWKEGKDKIRERDGIRAEFELYYPTNDKLRTNVAIAASEQAKNLGIDIKLVGSNWDEMVTKSHEVALLYAGGRHHPNQFYESHSPERAGYGWANITFYDNPKVMEYMNKAMTSTDLDEANKYWKLAQWDGETGASTLGDIPNCWLVRFNHTYLGDKRLNVGNQPIHSHGHDWSLLHNIYEWTWEENSK